MPKGEYLQYGGQAIIEGVMMRSPRFFSIACRAPNGEIIQQTEAIEKTWIGRQKWLKWPFLRGSLALLDSMALGIKAMRFASNVQVAPEYQKEGTEPDPGLPNKKIQDVAIGVTLVISLGLGLLLFNYVPNAVAEFTSRAVGTKDFRVTNLAAEFVKLAIFIAYIGLIGMLPDIREVFKFHGAEHKAINTMESDEPLDMDHCLAQTRLHPRCGTSFAIIVILLGFAVFTFIPRYPFGKHTFTLLDVTIRFGMELIVLPFIAGTAYELLRIAGKFRNTTLVNFFFWPGLMSQYLTTRVPEPKHVEVALAALKACIAAEDGSVATSPSDREDALESAPSPIG